MLLLQEVKREICLRKRRQTRRLFGTKQVAQILDLPEWRVKNFSEGGAYGLPPAQTLGTGRGSRRLYETPDICRIAIANELLNCGFTPEAVGRAVREIPESLLDETVWPDDTDLGDYDMEQENPMMLVCMHGKWRVRRPSELSSLALDKYVRWNGESTGMFMLNFGSLLSKVATKIYAFPRQAEQQQ